MLGFHHTEATKEKMRVAIRPPKAPMSAEHRANLSAAKRGVKHGPMPLAHREAIRISHIGTRLSSETRARIGRAHRGRVQSTDERALRKIAMGRPEVREKLRDKTIAAFARPEVQQRFSAAQTARRVRERAEVA
jgi:hypothetical protein